MANKYHTQAVWKCKLGQSTGAGLARRYAIRDIGAGAEAASGACQDRADLRFSGRLLPTFLWPLLFSGHYLSLAPTFLWPLLPLATAFLWPLSFSGPPSLAPTFLWPLLFSGHCLSLAPTFLWPLPFPGHYFSLATIFL